MSREEFLEEGFYHLISPAEPDPVLVHVYRCSDMNQQLVMGFNSHDGAAIMPLWDLSSESNLIPVSIEADEEALFTLITQKWTEEQVHDKISEMILDYLDDDWADEFENEQEAYNERGRGEAEQAVMEEVIGSVYNYHLCTEELKLRLANFWNVLI